MGDLSNIGKVLKNGLTSEFELPDIVDVAFREGRDSDDIRILLVDVVFAEQPSPSAAQSLTAAVRKLRPLLLANNEDAFPVFSFVTHRELSALAHEDR